MPPTLAIRSTRSLARLFALTHVGTVLRMHISQIDNVQMRKTTNYAMHIFDCSEERERSPMSCVIS